MQLIAKDEIASSGPDRAETVARLKILVSFCAGVLVPLLGPLLVGRTTPQSVLGSFRTSTGHLLIDIPMHFFRILNSPPVVLLIFVLFTYLAITRRRESRSWALAFVAGAQLPFLIFHWLLGWT